MSLFAELSKASIDSKFHDFCLIKSVSLLYTAAMPCDNCQEEGLKHIFMPHESVT